MTTPADEFKAEASAMIAEAREKFINDVLDILAEIRAKAGSLAAIGGVSPSIALDALRKEVDAMFRARL